MKKTISNFSNKQPGSWGHYKSVLATIPMLIWLGVIWGVFLLWLDAPLPDNELKFWELEQAALSSVWASRPISRINLQLGSYAKSLSSEPLGTIASLTADFGNIADVFCFGKNGKHLFPHSNKTAASRATKMAMSSIFDYLINDFTPSKSDKNIVNFFLGANEAFDLLANSRRQAQSISDSAKYNYLWWQNFQFEHENFILLVAFKSKASEKHQSRIISKLIRQIENYWDCKIEMLDLPKETYSYAVKSLLSANDEQQRILKGFSRFVNDKYIAVAVNSHDNKKLMAWSAREFPKERFPAKLLVLSILILGGCFLRLFTESKVTASFVIKTAIFSFIGMSMFLFVFSTLVTKAAFLDKLKEGFQRGANNHFLGIDTAFLRFKENCEKLCHKVVQATIEANFPSDLSRNFFMKKLQKMGAKAGFIFDQEGKTQLIIDPDKVILPAALVAQEKQHQTLMRYSNIIRGADSLKNFLEADHEVLRKNLTSARIIIHNLGKLGSLGVLEDKHFISIRIIYQDETSSLWGGVIIFEKRNFINEFIKQLHRRHTFRREFDWALIDLDYGAAGRYITHSSSFEKNIAPVAQMFLETRKPLVRYQSNHEDEVHYIVAKPGKNLGNALFIGLTPISRLKRELSEKFNMLQILILILIVIALASAEFISRWFESRFAVIKSELMSVSQNKSLEQLVITGTDEFSKIEWSLKQSSEYLGSLHSAIIISRFLISSTRLTADEFTSGFLVPSDFNRQNSTYFAETWLNEGDLLFYHGEVNTDKWSAALLSASLKMAIRILMEHSKHFDSEAAVKLTAFWNKINHPQDSVKRRKTIFRFAAGRICPKQKKCYVTTKDFSKEIYQVTADNTIPTEISTDSSCLCDKNRFFNSTFHFDNGSVLVTGKFDQEEKFFISLLKGDISKAENLLPETAGIIFYVLPKGLQNE